MAADFTTQVGRAAERIEASWSPERAAAILRQVKGRKKRQAQRRFAGALAAMLVLAVLSPRLITSLRGRRGSAGSASSTSVAKVPAPLNGAELAVIAPLHFRDGSVARPQGPASQVRLREDRPGRIVVELAGAAQFDVVHDPQRLFRVETHALAVEVLGTRFTVAEQGPRVRVTVQEGRVRVLWATHYDELTSGQSTLFPPEPSGNAGPTAAAVALPPLREPSPLAAGPTVAAGALPPLREPSPLAAGPTLAPGVLPPLREPSPLAPGPPLAAVALHPLREPSPLGAAPKSSTGISWLEPAPRSRARRGATLPEPTAAVAGPSLPLALPAEAPLPAVEPTSWQTLAHEGLFEQAYRIAYGAPEVVAHHAAEPPLFRERAVAPGELLLLADVARLSHHPADAMAPLSRLLREHAADPRAPLAAFTLGRVLLDDLGRPREAAQSFVRVQELDPDGPLSQDALAREVEAWSRAGEAASAHTRAVQYVQKYPEGRRLRSVRHFGELL